MYLQTKHKKYAVRITENTEDAEGRGIFSAFCDSENPLLRTFCDSDRKTTFESLKPFI